MPLITRVYGPESIGLFGMLLAFVNFASVAMALRYDVAVVGARDDPEAARLACGAAIVTVPTSILLGLAMLALVSFDLFGFGALPRWAAALVATLLILTSWFVILRFYLVRNGEFSAIGRALITQGGARAAVPVGAGTFMSGWEGLAIGELVARSIGIWGLWARSRGQLRASVVPLSLRRTFCTLWAYRRYPAVLLPSSVLDALALALPLPVLLGNYGARAAGLYVVVSRIISAPTQLVSGSFADVFHYSAQAEHGSGDSNLRTLIRGDLAKLLRIGGAIFLPTAVIAPFAFGTVFGADFAEAGLMFAILAPAALAAFAIGPLSRALVVVNRPDLKLVADGIAVIGATVPIYVANAVGFGLLGAVGGLCLGSLMGSVAYLVAILLATGQRNRP